MTSHPPQPPPSETAPPPPPPTIWVDVEDLFQYALRAARPSGIQRIEYELCRALATMPDTASRVRFLRHDSATGSFATIPYAAIAKLYARLVAAAPAPMPSVPSPADGVVGARWRPARDLLRRGAYRIPSALRAPVLQTFMHQRAALGTARESLRAAMMLGRGALKRGRPEPGRDHAREAAAMAVPPGQGFAQARPGDILLVAGSPWFHPFYGKLLARARREKQLRVALLVYDLIPLRRPEWCERNLTERFTAWFDSMLPLIDLPLTISRASAVDMQDYARRKGVSLPAPAVLRIGSGFSDAAEAPRDPARKAARNTALPPAGSYALIVSTIEARKNHILLFRVWRRLLEEKPAEAVPTLVFAGRVGWLVSDLMAQLRNADHLGGKVVVVENPSDADLRQLYAGCLFTLFPSLYEGWGLPVTESLAAGKPCLIADNTSLPEAGGTLARYFDADNLHDAYRAIAAAIDDRAGLAAWEAEVRAGFRPVAWTDTAASLLAAIDRGGVP